MSEAPADAKLVSQVIMNLTFHKKKKKKWNVPNIPETCVERTRF